jgi:hypothetical protein
MFLYEMKECKIGRKCYKYERYYNFTDRTRFLVFVLAAVHIVKLRIWILPHQIFCDNGLVYIKIILKVMPYE